MANVIFTIPSVLNQGNGEKKISISADRLTLLDAFAKISNDLGPIFKNRVLNSDGSPKSLINVYINGKNAQFYDGVNTILNDGDEIYILPAVSGGEQKLSENELTRYSRQIMLENIGYEGQLKIKNSYVCVIGVGGLGNPIISRLAAMGVGKIRIVDRDVIELSNLHRQTMFNDDDIGKIKVEAAKNKLKIINPAMNIEALSVSINDYNAMDVIQGCDIVIDALDSVNARYSINKACVQANIPFVTGAAVGTSGQCFTIIPSTTACYYCVFPNLDENSMPTCSIEGVHPSILSVVAGIEVSEAIKIILDKKPILSNEILHIDLDTLNFVRVKTFKVSECPICGTGNKNNNIAKKEKLVIEELCGRNGKRTFSITPTDNNLHLNLHKITEFTSKNEYEIENQSNFGISICARDFYISIMQKGSAIITGTKTENDAISLYDSFVNKLMDN